MAISQTRLLLAMSIMAEEVDVAIVGAGPAGLAAAVALKANGVDNIVVLEREPEAGGIPRHCGHPPFGLREFKLIMSGPSYSRKLVAQSTAAGVAIRTGTTVHSLGPNGQLTIGTDGQGISILAAKRVLLATGIRETPRSVRRISGSRPLGVLSTGALQSFVYLEGRSPFQRPVIIGTELVSFSALLTCRRAGIAPQAMIEENVCSTAYAACALYARWNGIPIHYQTRLVEIIGRDRVEAVILENQSEQTTLPCDGVLFTGQFTPAAELIRQSWLHLDPLTGGPQIDQFCRLSDPAYFAAGNLLRPVETAGWCYREGEKAGTYIARDLGGQLPSPNHMLKLECGSGLKYILPQRLTLDDTADIHTDLQLRVTHATKGSLTLYADDRAVWQRPLSLKPERRFLLPLSTIAPYRSATHLRLAIT